MKGKIFLSFIYWVLFFFAAGAQPSLSFGSSRSAALAGSGLTFEDGNSLLTNPAGIARLERPAFIIAAERPFLLPELQAASLIAAIPWKGGHFGLSLQRKGFDLFNRQQIGMAYARRITEGFTIGIRLWLFRTVTRDHGSYNAPGAELGFQLKILPELTFGGRLVNPAKSRTAAGVAPPATLALGLGYRPSEKVLALVEIEKPVETPSRIMIAVEYRPSPEVALRLGTSHLPASLSFGAGFHRGKTLTVDVGAGYHPLLGFSPGVSIQYSPSP